MGFIFMAMAVGMGRSRLVGVAALVVLAGCGDDGVGPGPAPSGSVRIVAPASTDVVVGDVLDLAMAAKTRRSRAPHRSHPVLGWRRDGPGSRMSS